MEKEIKELISLQREMVSILAILVKRGTLRTTLIKEFDEVGFPPKRTAELIGTTANTVSVSLAQSKNKK
jgi:hypothetical protein